LQRSDTPNPLVGSRFKSYDSPTVREWEPFSAALHDVRFGIACCDELLANRDAAIGANPTLQRALWDGVLVSIFKHYGQGANSDVRSIIDTIVAERGPQDVEALGEWHRERNHRIAHPVGFRESNHIVVELPTESGQSLRVFGLPFGALRPENAGMEWVREVLVEIENHLSAAAEALMPTIVTEINALTDDEILSLPDLEIPFFGTGRSPGSRRGSA
jgi:hypothetical protein